MKNKWTEFISIKDLYIAYKKAKAECFFDNVVPTALSFSEYEKNIAYNLRSLHKKLTTQKSRWFENLNNIGGYAYIPKSLDTSNWENKDNVIHHRATDPTRDWMFRFSENNNKKASAAFRLVISATVEFHIISALWILKVGHKFEEKLHKNLSYGNRLRRYGSSPLSPKGSLGELNLNTPSLFQPYYTAYQDWRSNGLNTMRTAVQNNESIYAITMDITKFYHNADPSFILDSRFLDKICVNLSEIEIELTGKLIAAITTWYKSTPDFEHRPNGAIPVGLSASKIISNVMLYELDNSFSNTIKPLYYGRYVDDFFIVIKQPDNCCSGSAVIEHLTNNIDCLIIDKQKNIKINIDYAEQSELIFKPEKQKIFLLDSQHGLDLIDQIENQIKKQSSEYRLLPDLPTTSSDMAKKALLATPDAKLEADALRKADGISIKRLGFSLLFKDINGYAQDLNPNTWKDIRIEFYGLIQRHILCPNGIYDFSSFLPRIMSLFISCQDFEPAKEFITKLKETLILLEKTTSPSINDGHALYKKHIQNTLKQATIQASCVKAFNDWDSLIEILVEIQGINGSMEDNTLEKIKLISNQLLISDLGLRSYKDYWYYDQKEDSKQNDRPKNIDITKLLNLKALSKFQESSEIKKAHWKAIAFPTRPLTIQEIVIVCPKVLNDYRLFKTAIMALRGAKTTKLNDIGFSSKNNELMISPFSVTPPNSSEKIRIALTNIETSEEQLKGAATGKPDRSLERYRNLNQLLNKILTDKGKPNYVVFPELSIPRKWAFNISLKLARNSISMIAGLEYYPSMDDSKKLHNDCLISLATRWPGYLSNIILFQPKLKPSHGERKLLKTLKKEQVEPLGETKNLCIFSHGRFNFGVLICSDFTNAHNRLHFQGNIDALFLLEWNRDINTFGFLVESAAHDIHTNIVQVNNRKYGDSRIRSPKNEPYERDNVRVKGGISDYYVIGEIDYKTLRKYQSEHLNTNGDIEDSSLAKTYKPLPIGFKMSPKRKII